MTPVYTPASIRLIENRAQARSINLMEKAGLSLAEFIRTRINPQGRVLILVGPGNNGGDGIVAARILRDWGVAVSLQGWLDPETLPDDARHAWEQWFIRYGSIEQGLRLPENCELIVDALFGIGLNRTLEAEWINRLQQINLLPCPILAVDVPSGVDAHTGHIHGAAIQANWTLTFIGLKTGLLTGSALEHTGQIIVDKLELAESDFEDAPQETQFYHVADWPDAIRQLLRPINSHKGLFGSLGIIGGGEGMIGAALLAGRAALKCGAGRVTLGLLTNSLSVDHLQPELMIKPMGSFWGTPHLTTLVIGPGLGTSDSALLAMQTAIDSPLPLIIDADGLNLLARDADLSKKLRTRLSPVILTPHPAEAARLLNTTTNDIQLNRISSVRAIEQQYNAVVLLKGAGSLIATKGKIAINQSGNPGLSAAGQGDVLSGICGGLLAQGLAPYDALVTAVYLHGVAADSAVAQGLGPIGLTASETIDAARHQLNHALRLIQAQRPKSVQ